MGNVQSNGKRDELATKLLHQRATAKPLESGKDEPFLPQGAIDVLVTKEAIRRELDLRSRRKDDMLVDWIHSHARKVFALTIQSVEQRDRKNSMECFRKSRFDDTSLPIDDPDSAETLRRKLPTIDDKPWELLAITRFRETQWQCLVPVFSTANYDHNLSSSSIFPFIWKDEKVYEGNFSKVHCVKIHSAHHNHPFQKFALKDFKTGGLSEGDRDAADKAWEEEAKALADCNTINHPHMIRCLAAIRRNKERYFLFPWADGGNLRDYWNKMRGPCSADLPRVVRHTVQQLREVADAVDALHNFEGNPNKPTGFLQPPSDSRGGTHGASVESIRHGDLKPENLLRWGVQETDTNLGTLMIADMGLAKRHVAGTLDRTNPTTTRYGTVHYEAPEGRPNSRQARSRLYDVWSMGCIILEFLIWVLYENIELRRFLDQFNNTKGQLFEMYETGSGEIPRVHPIVEHWMDHIRHKDPACKEGTAIFDLLELVREKLLVIRLPPNRPSRLSQGSRPLQGLARFDPDVEIPGCRATAKILRKRLDDILHKIRNPTEFPDYLITGVGREDIRAPIIRSTSYPSSGRDATNTRRRDNYLQDWEFIEDHRFGQTVWREIGSAGMNLPGSGPRMMCDSCNGRDFWAGGFKLEVDVEEDTNEDRCDFCRMLCDLWDKDNSGHRIRLERDQSDRSTLRRTDVGLVPVLSIIKSPSLETPIPIRLGFPQLPKPDGDVFFRLLRLWLQDCDEHHEGCKRTSPLKLPTRLIDVGTEDEPRLHLLETRDSKRHENQYREYIALSHPWGDPVKHPPFKTIKVDLDGSKHDVESFKKAIPYGELPKTFKDAVDTTRKLGIRYLWIDSICIIQGDGGDWDIESKQMEAVFSSAYCVLAASRATGQHDGFLKEKPLRDVFTFQRPNQEPFWVCEHIDDFGRDVLEGPLNTRGWVFQEHALARRTIFFAQSQTYFECGDGIRCETLGKMRHDLVGFLGDPNFPEKALRNVDNSETTRGQKIMYFQQLYKDYSKLAFSHMADKPVAIRGLETRLCAAYKVSGVFGILNDGRDGGLFHRSLLWCRDQDDPMGLINFTERNIYVPTWSWMAYEGSIDYVLLREFNQVHWEEEDVCPPNADLTDKSLEAAALAGDLDILVRAREFVDAVEREGQYMIKYDSERTTSSDGNGPCCVIVAKHKGGASITEKLHYVLIVAPKDRTGRGGKMMYERLGAGYMLGKYIKTDKPYTEGWVH